MIVLAMETSCDETAAAVVDENRVLSSVVWTQLKLHQRWGGVVPSIARRAHEERLPGLVEQALKRSGKEISDIDAIAVTIGPGLAPALEVGVACAKKLAFQHQKPLIPVSHLEGHIASLSLRRKSGFSYVKVIDKVKFPVLNLIVSGGHTELVISKLKTQNSKLFSTFYDPRSIISHRLIGQTLDDAAGECLDKVGRALGLGYPAGPVIEKLAAEFASKGQTLYTGSDLNTIRFPIPMERSPKDNLDFSFSGLKTAAVRNLSNLGHLGYLETHHFCASFQNAVIEVLLLKVRRAVDITGIKTLLLSGGVAANNRLRQRLRHQMKKLGGTFFAVDKKFTGDNAAMIGLAAQWANARGETMKPNIEIESIDRKPNLNFPSVGLT